MGRLGGSFRSLIDWNRSVPLPNCSRNTTGERAIKTVWSIVRGARAVTGYSLAICIRHAHAPASFNQALAVFVCYPTCDVSDKRASMKGHSRVIYRYAAASSPRFILLDTAFIRRYAANNPAEVTRREYVKAAAFAL